MLASERGFALQRTAERGSEARGRVLGQSLPLAAASSFTVTENHGAARQQRDEAVSPRMLLPRCWLPSLQSSPPRLFRKVGLVHCYLDRSLAVINESWSPIPNLSTQKYCKSPDISV